MRTDRRGWAYARAVTTGEPTSEGVPRRRGHDARQPSPFSRALRNIGGVLAVGGAIFYYVQFARASTLDEPIDDWRSFTARLWLPPTVMFWVGVALLATVTFFVAAARAERPASICMGLALLIVAGIWAVALLVPDFLVKLIVIVPLVVPAVALGIAGTAVAFLATPPLEGASSSGGRRALTSAVEDETL